MRIDKQKAIENRLKGLTYTEISEILSVPKSTLSFWLRDLKLTKEVQQMITSKYRAGYTKGLLKKSQLQTKQAVESNLLIRKNAAASVKNLSIKELKALGIGLYWGEGYKKSRIVNGQPKTTHPVSLSNSDPKLIQAYIKFLTEICKVPKAKLRASVRMYPQQNINKIHAYWRKTTGLPLTQFTKPYFGISISSQQKKSPNILPYGTIRIDVYDTKLFYKVMGWIDGFQNLLA